MNNNVALSCHRNDALVLSSDASDLSFHKGCYEGTLSEISVTHF